MGGGRVSPSARQYDFVRFFLRFRSLVRTVFRCSRNNRGNTDERKNSNDGGCLTRVGTALTRAFGSLSNFVVNGAASVRSSRWMLHLPSIHLVSLIRGLDRQLRNFF